jgi:hypothetical protein
MVWVVHVAFVGEKRNAYKVSVGESEGKWPFGRPRRIWEDIGLDLCDLSQGISGGIL